MISTNRLISLFAAIVFATTMMAEVVYEPLIVAEGFNRDVIAEDSPIGNYGRSYLLASGTTYTFGTVSTIKKVNDDYQTKHPGAFNDTSLLHVPNSGWPDDYRDTIWCREDGDAYKNDKFKDVFWLLAPYDQPNAVCVRPDTDPADEANGIYNEGTGTIKFKKVGCYRKLFFLFVSAKNDGSAPSARTVTTTVYYTDGSSQSTDFTCAGFSGKDGHRVRRINTYEGYFKKWTNIDSGKAYATVFSVELEGTKLVDRITFSNSINHTVSVILAVTGMTADMEVPDEESMEVSDIDKTSFQACWDAIEDAASYRLDVAEDIDFQRILEDYNNLPVSGSTCKDIVDLVSNTDYYWRVRSVNADGGQSASSAPRCVKTAPDPEKGDEPPYTDEEYTNIEENLAQYIGTKATLAELDIHRTLYRDGAFNTLCLPFDLNAEQIAASPLAGAQVYEFVHAAKNQSGQLDIEISGPIDAITAGVPYLIKWNPTLPEIIDGGILVFKNVNVSTNHGQTLGEEGEVQFVGNIGIATLVEEEQLGYDHNKLFLGAANTLYWPEENTHLKGFRAYFIVPDNDNGAPKRTPARLVMHQDVTTDVIRIQPSAVSVQKALQNGQIVILREGKRYSILGTQL